MTVGVVGLGNMGGALAANLLERGVDLVVHDAFAPERAPAGVEHMPDVAEVARRCGVVVLSLPDATASQDVARTIAATAGRRLTHVVDTSTIGVRAAQEIDAVLGDAGVGYVDAPVSGGPAGARARTLTVMFAATDDACARVMPVLEDLSDRRHRVGDRPGMAQAVKLANNFLSATALAATSEAIAFGEAAGVDMATMLDVLNASSGRNTATSDKFPIHVITEQYASGFASALMAKDVRLYVETVAEQAGPSTIAAVTADVWDRFATADPGADFTRIYPFVRST